MLTIGMATYDDYHGVYFTVVALKLYQNLPKDTEIIVIDNNPTSEHGKQTKHLCTMSNSIYYPYTEKSSTSVREQIFKKAKGDYVLSLDSHVLLHEGAIESLLDYYKKNPDTKDILSGPMCYEGGDVAATHMEEVWRDHMYGTWDLDATSLFAGEPFETRMMGLGIFSCKKSNWPGFNENFRGFGGEEGYIHEKIRRNGGRSICIPQLKWTHRFGRPDGVKYTLDIKDRIFNYFLGWIEITNNPNDIMVYSIRKHFIEQTQNKNLIDTILEEAISVYLDNGN